MAHPWHHSVSSARKWGGQPEDYLPIHNWFDASKAHYADFRHRALRHHSEGIFWCETVFGPTITNSDGSVIPVRWIGEQHVKEDLGRIPTLRDWLRHIKAEPWMSRGVQRNVGREVDEGDEPHRGEVQELREGGRPCRGDVQAEPGESARNATAP